MGWGRTPGIPENGHVSADQRDIPHIQDFRDPRPRRAGDPGGGGAGDRAAHRNVLWPDYMLGRSLPFIGVMFGFGIIVALAMGLPRIKMSAFDVQTAQKIALFATILGATGTVLNIVLNLGAPRTVPMIFGFLVFCLSVGWKLAASQFLDLAARQRNAARARRRLWRGGGRDPADLDAAGARASSGSSRSSTTIPHWAGSRSGACGSSRRPCWRSWPGTAGSTGCCWPCPRCRAPSAARSR